ncbi:thioredoxin domain-containing protein [Mycobacterium sp. E740]|uniref:DsbA family protein n=1 Tax=Mycobacterium sp. E740 TaxID=1834149 RepID=UPI0007FD260C|nr:thioredoxin domain-containing protein [Mycobacterium sp. E740]OBI77000.1 protein-disulfide isomerase [Mycobacterium sp. E740]
MRISRLVAVVGLAAMLVVPGCTRNVAGTAQRDPAQPALTVSEDGYGVVAGFDGAPARIEIFTEPQCNHCADLQADFGDRIAYYIGVGQLEVTYRPLTFLDHEHNGHSARVSNALFLATGGGATGTQLQRFVQELWAHQDPGGPGPSDDEMAAMAKTVGMPEQAVNRISGGGSAVNVVEMDQNNFEYLYEIDPLQTGTPTVYDLVADERVDIYDNDWLNKLLGRER